MMILYYNNKLIKQLEPYIIGIFQMLYESLRYNNCLLSTKFIFLRNIRNNISEKTKKKKMISIIQK